MSQVYGEGPSNADESPLRIVADANIPGLDTTFAQHGSVTRLNGRNLTSADLRTADILLVRSVTRVDARLLDDTPVRFVASATIGTDHLDRDWLDRNGVTWIHAPGCNADAAAQYSVAMLLLSARRLGFELSQKTLGVVGHGNVGSRVGYLLNALGIESVRIYDPPLAEAGQSEFCSMDEISRCDIISLHVPLTRSGRWPTFHLIDRDFLRRLPAGALLVNSSRGDVVHGEALLRWLRAGKGHAALDVWPGEPRPDPELIRAATVATPHVAGYSLDGKYRGTLCIYAAFREWLGKDPAAPELLRTLPPRHLPEATRTAADAILAACPVEQDDAAMRRLTEATATEIGTGFDALRAGYAPRRDFAGWQVPTELPQNLKNQLRALRFDTDFIDLTPKTG
ncbi:4-phosphoerythronate dehydrogenase [Elongatibacter sediminis]|uniref:Erythronate-4-phosphate dehydrogenase n=1 Tax=Elongatibacter sediminis TaxID=3119006 RepID=A0AAW9RBV8_9GAMM